MPSFSSLLKNSRIRSDSRQEDRMDSGVSLDTVNNVNNEKVQRRQSKRDFVRGLLKRSSVGGKRRPNTQIKVADPRASPINFSSMPPSPMSPKSDPNKPLPPPPASGTVNEESAKAPVKLDRIMSPIGASELHKIFQGAPQFFSRAEEQQTGEPFPSVAFPWDTNVSIRDLSDHIQIPNAAWSSVTAWPHITRDLSRNPETVSELHENQKTHYMPGCRERPNMLSMQGIERGTMGFQAALESEVADALKEDEQEFTDGTTLADRRAEFIHSKDGVRAFSESTLIELLMNVSTTYHEDPLRNSRSEVQLYSELFTQLLHPPRRVLDAEDPYSLQVQIEVLLRVLESPGVWIDFSLVEWRIRLGQIIWGPPPNPDPEDFMSVDGEQVEPDAQKFWLLLQILLSCELIVRLDAISQNQEGRDKSRSSALERFDNSVTEEVKWSLILGRLWLENIRIERTKPDTVHERKSSGSWLSALTGRTPSDGDDDDENAGVSYLDNFQFRGRNQDRQLSGLLYFAQELQWPHIEPLAAKVSANLIRISDSVPTTPLVGTPLTAASQPSSSYFPDRRPPIRRGISRPQKISMLVNPTGWLSNSYLSGLILPGESMSHLLISTLLENDDRAVSVLGEDTNLYGGFIYYDRSFWSTSSIVGRVLAARKGANECMGWVSSDVTPRNFIGEVWVNVDVDTTLVSAPDKPRIWQETSIEHDGDVIAGADASSVLPGDFAIPKEHPSQQTYFITLKSFELFESTESVHSTPTREIPTPYSNVSKTSQIQTYSAMMNFVIEGQVQKELSYALHHDVLFVTAHPCVPSSHLQMLNSPTSPEFQLPRNRVAGSVSGHALHKAFSYSQVPLSVLLVSPSQSLTSLLSPALSRSRESPSPSPSSSGPIKTVLVIDCTYTEALSQHISSMHISISEPKHTLGNDMEVLVRALCAEKGWNALISRRGQSCIACAVRELNALGWAETGVVLRL